MTSNPTPTVPPPKASPSFEFPCTECGGDAYIGLSDWIGPDGQIIDKDERLCTRCAKKRNIEWKF